ncbi:MAG: hypothetical protein R2747_00065 [Pyrinomonadaceae bacterium]
MTELDPKNLSEIKRFLFGEMPESEREAVEERLFTDESFFYDLMEVENSLIDAYARGELRGDDLRRFEASLDLFPERREKIANSIALNSLIKEEKREAAAASAPVEISEPVPGFWERIAAFFRLNMSVVQFAGAAALLLLVAGTGFLIYERVRMERELAEYRENQRRFEELQKRQEELQKDLREIRQREQNLQKQLGEKQGESEILDQQLEREKSERQRLENELERLKKLQQNPPPPGPRQPTIASFLVLPFSGGKGANDPDNIKTIRLAPGVKSVNLTLQLPKDAAAETFSVRFKGETLASNRKPGTTRSGFKFLTLTIPSARFSLAEDNVIAVTGDDEVRYNFVLKVQK